MTTESTTWQAEAHKELEAQVAGLTKLLGPLLKQHYNHIVDAVNEGNVDMHGLTKDEFMDTFHHILAESEQSNNPH